MDVTAITDLLGTGGVAVAAIGGAALLIMAGAAIYKYVRRAF